MRTRATKSLCLLIRTQIGKPKVGCEVGVWRGQTARVLLARFPNLVLCCVDPWETGGSHLTLPSSIEGFHAAKQEFFATTDFAASRRRVLEIPSTDAARKIENGALDFVFIDAEHLYETVLEDIQAWVPKVRVGGLISGHDYNAPYDKKGIFGVKQAVDEYAQQNGCTVQLVDGDIWWLKKEENCGI